MGRSFSSGSKKTEKVEGNLFSSIEAVKSKEGEKNKRTRRKVVKDPTFKLPDSSKLLESETEMEAYRFIRRKQKKNLDEARAKTAANVRRALGGNMLICCCKFGAWLSSGSSSMLSEFVHSVVDCGNQSLLLIGLRDSGNVADRRHPYGYGKSIYFWALVSALGTFFLGAGVSMTHAFGELINPSLQNITWQVWGVLGASLVIDGYVFGVTLKEIADSKPKNRSLLDHVSRTRDPATLAILLEDGAACLGIVIALAGISASHATGNPVFDGLAGVGISGLLATMGLILVRVNHRFLLGQAVDNEITEGIERILRNRRSIDNVHSVQSQWTSSDTFSYKAEVDFDGTFLAAKLMPRYQQEFLQVKESRDEELRVLLSWYAEDVIRTVEREVRHIEAEIRKEYPGAEYIELEPMSKDADRFAVDDGMESQLRKIEIEALNRYLRSLYQPSRDDDKVKGESSSSAVKNPQKDDSKP
eukprot:CAMPEP_0178925108 /NCGR_PEP_ID=MMETSP0786-20121207/17715_1 /TAXON_ID=186022 /ORGANISM="Thalassionema frauenfeldii, Strain CCMP 1798" /LENGTH=472 /DNA_ID=CAMNT_0020599925 /DNA_START=537 /DNA_END=1955 /DNA_ORIENTATION=-